MTASGVAYDRGCKAKVTLFDENGNPDGISSRDMFLPDYLDWIPIEAKIFWFLKRGLGDPRARMMLFQSQGEQRISLIDPPLQELTFKQLKDIDNELENQVEEFCTREGIDRTPRNQ